MANTAVIDSSLLTVPLASLRRAAKDRKTIVDDANAAIAEIAQCANLTKEQQLQQLDSLVVKLQGLKRKLADVSKTEKDESHRCKARLEHLYALGSSPDVGTVAWNELRLDRILVDHLLRSGYHTTALQLAQESDILHLVDIHIFQGARRVVEALQNHDCAAALQWCAEHQPRLKKIKSNLEFKLRVQEFIELVRQEKRVEAIEYARKQLAQWAPLHMQDLQRAVATLAFTKHTRCAAAGHAASRTRSVGRRCCTGWLGWRAG
jgi:macrophage erythroblast attacher